MSEIAPSAANSPAPLDEFVSDAFAAGLAAAYYKARIKRVVGYLENGETARALDGLREALRACGEDR